VIRFCSGCSKVVGTGTLLDEFPEPPAPQTTVYWLYLAETMKAIGETEHVIGQEEWETFAKQYRCLLCVNATQEISGQDT
jgi:hypothetical protein